MSGAVLFEMAEIRRILRAAALFALISLLGGLWNAIKMTTEVKQDSMFLAARGRDAVISLERNREGQVVISKISFKATQP